MRPILIFVLGLTSVAGGGCRTWGTLDGYTWTVKAPSKVANIAGNEMTFTVETKTQEGQRAEGISYYWAIDWVGVRGASRKGTSYSKQTVRVKGYHGTATLRVYGYDRDEKIVEVGSAPFEVE